MSRTTEHFMEGDTVTDHDGNTGMVVSCMNGRTRERFLSVRVIDGPRKGQWDKLHAYTAALDHPGGTLRTSCLLCGRGFLAVPRVLGDLNVAVPKQEFCRTCLPGAERAERARFGSAQTATQVHDRIKRPWRDMDWQRQQPVEPVVHSEPEHPDGCMCGLRPECNPFGATCSPHDGQGRR